MPVTQDFESHVGIIERFLSRRVVTENHGDFGPARLTSPCDATFWNPSGATIASAVAFLSFAPIFDAKASEVPQ